MRVDAEERGVVAQFFAMLKDDSWSHASSADGTDVFKLPGERIHRIMGVTRTDATPEEVLTFFSDPLNFDKHFKILDAMFKAGSVVKIGGAGLEAPDDDDDGRARGSSASGRSSLGQKMTAPRVGNFAALSVGGDEGHRGGGEPLADRLGGSVSGLLARLRVSGPGAKIEEALLRATKNGEREGKQPDANAASVASRLARLPSAQTEATRDALARSDETSPWRDGDDVASDSETFAMRVSDLIASAESREPTFADRPGHALLHGTFRLPSVVPDRDFVWDQVALRLPTGSVLIAGKSVDIFGEDELVPVSKGHVRGAVLTSGYYVAPETATEGGGSKIAFVVQADPKGSLPAWVVNFVAPKQAHNVTRLRKFLDGR